MRKGYMYGLLSVLLMLCLAWVSVPGNRVYQGILDFAGDIRIDGTTMTATATELNKLDGVTATTAELNRLDGSVTAGTTTVTDAGPTDDLDVSEVNIVFLDTSSNNVTIGGFVGGSAGQVLHVAVSDASNNSTLENAESTGNQDMNLLDGADETLTGSYGGWTLVCDGSAWYEVQQ